MILHALVRGITDGEIREQVLAKTEELGLEETSSLSKQKRQGVGPQCSLSRAVWPIQESTRLLRTRGTREAMLLLGL